MSSTLEVTNKLIEAIQKAVTPEIKTDANGNEYSTAPVYTLPEKEIYRVETLDVSTLTGLVEYILGNRDGISNQGLLIQVVNAKSVRLIGPTDEQGGREVYAQATYYPEDIKLGFALEIEDQIIQLLTLFDDQADRNLVVKLIGNITDNSVTTVVDDGHSQEVTTRKGLGGFQNTQVQNPVRLAPFATFPDIMQPTGPFMVRLNKREGKLPTVTVLQIAKKQLEEETIREIKEFLNDQLQQNGVEIPVIG